MWLTLPCLLYTSDVYKRQVIASFQVPGTRCQIQLAVGLCPIPVSYTHLDVYKRQALPYDPKDLEFVGVEVKNMKNMENLTNDRLHTNGTKACLLYTSSFPCSPGLWLKPAGRFCPAPCMACFAR